MNLSFIQVTENAMGFVDQDNTEIGGTMIDDNQGTCEIYFGSDFDNSVGRIIYGNYGRDIIQPEHFEMVVKNALNGKHQTLVLDPNVARELGGNSIVVSAKDADGNHQDLRTSNTTSSTRSAPNSSNSSTTPNDEGCYIATAVYGDYDALEVLALRKFRDNVLKNHLLGRVFISFYYKISPPLANKLKDMNRVNKTVRRILDKFVEMVG